MDACILKNGLCSMPDPISRHISKTPPPSVFRIRDFALILGQNSKKCEKAGYLNGRNDYSKLRNCYSKSGNVNSKSRNGFSKSWMFIQIRGTIIRNREQLFEIRERLFEIIQLLF